MHTKYPTHVLVPSSLCFALYHAFIPLVSPLAADIFHELNTDKLFVYPSQILYLCLDSTVLSIDCSFSSTPSASRPTVRTQCHQAKGNPL